MKKLIVLTAAGAASISLLTSGVASAASAPDETGKKYSDASADLKKAGYKVEVISTVGSRVPQSDCLVANQRSESVLPVGIKKYQITESKNVLVALDCNPKPAPPTPPH
jgi:hypothetical protein